VNYDVVVIGAGIHGAGAAQAAAAAGHSVLLLEQTAIAAGTSSRSSKLIHGGLRYLETFQLALVRESLHERATLLRIAPSLVRLRRFLIPVYDTTRRRPWQLRTGLSLYAALAGFRPEARFGTLARSAWDALPGLTTTGLKAVFWYYDAQTDDRLLTQAVVRSAQALGAQLALPAQFLGAQLTDAGAHVHYRGAAGERECDAHVLVNAAGPWADAVAAQITPAVAIPAVERVQGTHITLPETLGEDIFYVESPRDGRAVFLMPWHGQLLVGTTETRSHADPAGPAPTTREVHYLLGVLKHYFPRFRHYAPRDVVASFAGLRVLPREGAHPFRRSRETLLIPDRAARPRVLSIYGGKLTTWRAVSARALGVLAGSLPKRPARARTDRLELRLDRAAPPV
jgi:glycerol-3-phosphate dehydrogenase